METAIMDIADLLPAFKEGMSNGEFAILDPFGKPTDLVLAIAGPYSHERHEARHQLQDAISKASFNSTQPHKRTPIPSKDMEKLEDEYLASQVLGWSGLTEHGKPLIRTNDEALRLLRRAPWIRQQVNRIVSDDKAFMQQLQKKTPYPEEERRLVVLGRPSDIVEDDDNN